MPNLAHLISQVDDIHKAIFGTSSSPGMKVEVDRNTQHRLTNQKWKWVLIVAVIGTMSTAVVALIN